MNIGDYVKTKSGYICKIININDFREPSMKYGVEVSSISDVVFMGDEDIIKSSSNIIDLIEVGDYVNGHLVTKKTKDGFIWLEAYSKDGTLHYVDFINEWGDNIKSIVTKEQFKNMEYKL